MKPYYQDKWVTIYNADCREILPQLDDVALTLTDFPYGVNFEYGSYVDSQDNLKELISDVMPMILKVSKRTMLTCGVSNMYLYPVPDWVMAWVIPAGAGRRPWGFGCWQPILVYGRDPYLENSKGSIPDIFISNETTVIKSHPCSKPENLWQKILHRGSVDTNDLILDPFLGSGTTCYCAKKLNRYSIGIEIEERYCEIAARRCSQEVMELNIETE